MQVAFYKGNASIFEKLIRWYTRSPYSHCELIFSDGMASYIGGDVWETTNCAKQYDAAAWDMILIPLTAEDEAVVRSWTRARLGRKYDWVGIFLSQIIPWNIDDHQRYFCSEWVMEALQSVGFFRGRLAQRFNPGKLYRLLTEEKGGASWKNR